MIIQTGLRTDIPAFYSEWFANRIKEQYVLVRNPHNPSSVTKYTLDPSVVDLICFCSKNPEPMLKYMELLKPYRQCWFVTITPYGKDIEPNVPDKHTVIDTFKKVSGIVGTDRIAWRYDPVIINNKWTVTRHINEFCNMAEKLSGYTKTCIVSFLDLYAKVRKNFPEATTVSMDEQIAITKAFVRIGEKYGMRIKLCGEQKFLEQYGADGSGCMTIKVFEDAIGARLDVPGRIPGNRKECACYLTGDIGAYDTCGHLCRYCYANTSKNMVAHNMRQHNPTSPFLIGNAMQGDIIHEAVQKSWIDRQMRLEF